MTRTLPALPGLKAWQPTRHGQKKAQLGIAKPWAMLALGASFLTAAVPAAQAQKYMERLDRGVVAVRTSADKVYVGWRLSGTDPSNIAFNVYRGTTKLNTTPITGSTNYVDEAATNATAYSVRAIVNGVEQPASAAASVWGKQFLSIPIQAPAGGTTPDGVAYTYSANDASVGAVGIGHADRNMRDASGYTMLENYLNGLGSVVTGVAGRTIRAGALVAYPNPAGELLMVAHPVATRGAKVLVYSFDGKKVAEVASEAGSQQTPVSLERLARGNYLLVYTSGAESLTTKVIKE